MGEKAESTTIATVDDDLAAVPNSENVDRVGIDGSLVEKMGQLKLSSCKENDVNNNKGNTGDQNDEEKAEDTKSTVKEQEIVIHEEKNQDSRRMSTPESVGDKSNSGSPKRVASGQSAGHMSPAEFFQTSRLRSSALANKLNTTQTFGGSTDLLHASSGGTAQVEEITKGIENVALGTPEKKSGSSSENEDAEGEKTKSKDQDTMVELIDRSPVLAHMNNRQVHHPYQQPQPPPQQQSKYYMYQESANRYGQPRPDASLSYSPAYYMEQQRYKAAQCVVSRPVNQHSPAQMVPAPVPANYIIQGQAGCYVQQHAFPAATGFIDQCDQPTANHHQYTNITPPPFPDPLFEINQASAKKSPMAVLSPFDFSPSRPVEEANISGAMDEKWASEVAAVSCGETAQRSRTEFKTEDMPDELCDFILTYSRHYREKDTVAGANEYSQLSAELSKDYGGNQASIVVSEAVHSPFVQASDTADLFSPVNAIYVESPTAIANLENDDGSTDGRGNGSGATSARQRLREHIKETDLEEAWAWAMRCCQSRPDALFFRDKDGDSLLHIVIWHKDLAKIYVLTEMMYKRSNGKESAEAKLFDLPNKSNETPLYLAIEKGLANVVAYLLECGADANVRPKHDDADLPLHYAATRGMADMVEIIVASGRIEVDFVNAIGQTALLCAVKNHGNVDEENQCAIDNALVIKALLNAGADATIADGSNGRNVVHYCVEGMHPALLQLLGDHLDRNQMARLVNACDYNGCTPLAMLSRSVLSCGAPDSEETMLNQKMSKLLLEYSVSSQFTADDFGDLAVLLSDQVPTDSLPWSVLDNLLSSETY